MDTMTGYGSRIHGLLGQKWMIRKESIGLIRMAMSDSRRKNLEGGSEAWCLPFLSLYLVQSYAMKFNETHVLYMHDLRATYFRVNPVNLHAM